MSRAPFVFAASTALALAACSQTSGNASDGPLPSTASEAVSEAPPDPPSQAPGHAIATVVTHDAKVTVMGGGSDLRFVVRKLDGAIVADNITESTLRSTDPLLHAIVTSAVASNDRVKLSGRSHVGREYVDATLDSRGSSTPPAALGPGQPLGL